MAVKYIPPWRGGLIHFPVQNMGTPDQLRVKQLIPWIADEIIRDKKVHIGCIGGHGRTGMMLSVLVNHMTGMKDSTTYVRENYCKRAVESQRQVDWLHTFFGIKEVQPTKKYSKSGVVCR